ncbi:MAG: hypothetical protein ABEI74_02270 [Candidatus Pacearchaeota archaeon]
MYGHDVVDRSKIGKFMAKNILWIMGGVGALGLIGMGHYISSEAGNQNNAQEKFVDSSKLEKVSIDVNDDGEKELGWTYGEKLYMAKDKNGELRAVPYEGDALKPEDSVEVTGNIYGFEKDMRNHNLTKIQASLQRGSEKETYYVGYDSSSNDPLAYRVKTDYENMNFEIDKIENKSKALSLYNKLPWANGDSDKDTSKTNSLDSNVINAVAGGVASIIKYFDSASSQRNVPGKHDSTAVYDTLQKTDSIEKRLYNPKTD